jgi:integrase/recombinase XerD
MMTFTELATAASDPPPEPFTDRLRLAVAAYLARLKGSSREHTESDLRCYLSWCAEHGLDPLAAQRPYLELYIRWMQEIRRFKPSTTSRRFSVVAGFYRTCVIDGLLPYSPAEHVRRPRRARRITHPRVHPPAVRGAPHCRPGIKGTKVVQIPLPPAVGRAIDRAAGRREDGPILLNGRGARMDRHAATRRLRHLAQTTGLRARIHPHMLRHTFVPTSFDAGVDLRDVQIAARHADPRTTMRYDRARTNLDRHPNYILPAYMSSAT